MVGLIIKTPLAKNDIGTGVLDSGNHVCEVVLLHLLEALVVLSALDFETVLGLGLGWLEWAGEDAHLSIIIDLLHLWMRELLIKDNTVDERRIFESTASLGDDLDKVEVDITTLEIGDVEDSSDSQVCVVILALADDLGAEGGSGAGTKLGIVVLEDIKFLLDLLNSCDGDIAGSLETIGNFQGVDTSLKKLLGLLEDGTGEDYNTSRTITDLIVLGGGKLSQKSSSLVMNLLNKTECERILF